MLTYCLKCRKNTMNEDAKIVKHKNDALSSKCVVCGSRISRFMKEQEAEGLLSNLGIKTLLNKIPLLKDLLVYLLASKMNQIVNKVLLAGDKFMPDTHLKEPGFIHSACGPFAKNKQRIQKFIQT